MGVILYTNKPSNLPSAEPLWQPVVIDQSILDLDYVAAQISQALGYQTEVVKNVLAGLSSKLPYLLSMGIVDLDFITLSVGMTSTTTDPDTSWSSTTAPLTIRVTLRRKSDMLALIRTLITMQKVPYIPKVPTITDVNSRYNVSNRVPLGSTFEVTGQDLRLIGRELVGYLSETETWDAGLGDQYAFDDIALATNTRIITQLPYAMVLEGQTSPYVKLGIYSEENTYMTPPCSLIYGGVKYLCLNVATSDYADMGSVSMFRFTLTDDVLTVAIKSAASPSTYGADVEVVDQTTITVPDSSATPIEFPFYVGAGAVSYYTTAASEAPFEVEGWRE